MLSLSKRAALVARPETFLAIRYVLSRMSHREDSRDYAEGGGYAIILFVQFFIQIRLYPLKMHDGTVTT